MLPRSCLTPSCSLERPVIEQRRTLADSTQCQVCRMWLKHFNSDGSLCRKSDRDKTLKVSAPDGTIESAYDNTSQPLYDSRVWLHMFEGPDGKLLPSFCKRTGAAQYMYDFTGTHLYLDSCCVERYPLSPAIVCVGADALVSCPRSHCVVLFFGFVCPFTRLTRELCQYCK